MELPVRTSLICEDDMAWGESVAGTYQNITCFVFFVVSMQLGNELTRAYFMMTGGKRGPTFTTLLLTLLETDYEAKMYCGKIVKRNTAYALKKEEDAERYTATHNKTLLLLSPLFPTPELLSISMMVSLGVSSTSNSGSFLMRIGHKARQLPGTGMKRMSTPRGRLIAPMATHASHCTNVRGSVEVQRPPTYGE
jgi:hypothetical protein